jgi:hypothetical protein
MLNIMKDTHEPWVTTAVQAHYYCDGSHVVMPAAAGVPLVFRSLLVLSQSLLLFTEQ